DAWTLEVSFKPYAVDGDRVIIAKGGTVFPRADPWIFLRRRGRSGRLELGLVDGSGVFRNLLSRDSLQPDEWYNIAATGASTEISLWIKGPGDADYQWQGTTPVSGAFYNGS